jgi:MFS family permease
MRTLHSKIEANIKKLYLHNFFFEMMFFIPILVPFWSGLGFSMQEILLIEAGFAMTLMLLEIPSGYFADMYGRKTSMMIGAVLEFIGLLIFIFAGSFSGFLLGEIVIGIGASFQSGANEALMYDSLVQLKREKEYKKKQGNYYFAGRMSAVLSKIPGALFAGIFIKLPFYLTMIPWFIAVIVVFSLVEPTIKRQKFETWKHFTNICKEALFKNKKLQSLLLYGAIPPGFFLITFWLYQKYMETTQVPIIYFGIIISLMNLTSGLGGKYAKEIEEKITPKLTIILIPITAALVWASLAVFSSPYLIWIFAVAAFVWGLHLPITQDYIQKITTSDKRATILSIRSFLTRVVYVIFAPLLGWVTDCYSIQSAFGFSAGLIILFGGISLLLLKRGRVI